MKELLLAFAKLMPEENMVNELRNALAEYDASGGSDRSKQMLGLFGMILSIKFGTEGKDLAEVLTDLKKAEAGMKLMNTDDKAN